jgi:hypothetical protein
MRCKIKTACQNQTMSKTKNGKNLMRSTCAECGGKKCCFKKGKGTQEGDGLLDGLKSFGRWKRGLTKGSIEDLQKSDFSL